METFWLLGSGLLLVLAIFVGWRAWLDWAFVLNPERLRCWFLDSWESDQLVAASPTLQEMVRQLRQLGFRLLGVKAEQMPGRREVVREIVLTSPDPAAYTGLVLSKRNQLFSVYFYTPLAGGGMVFTRARSTLPERETPDTSIKNVAANNWEALWGFHCQRLQIFEQQGLRPIARHDQPARVEATQAYYTSPYGRALIRQLWGTPALMNLALALLLLIAAVVIGGWGYYLGH